MEERTVSFVPMIPHAVQEGKLNNRTSLILGGQDDVIKIGTAAQYSPSVGYPHCTSYHHHVDKDPRATIRSDYSFGSKENIPRQIVSPA